MNLTRLQNFRICVSKAYRLHHATQICRGLSSLSHVDPIIRDFTGKMAETRPTIRVSPDRIRVLQQPIQFLDTLIVSITQHYNNYF
jgi:hypothetical protein